MSVSTPVTGVPIHPSHQLEQDWDFPDPHNPGVRCTVCRESACSMCPLEGDDDLAVTCLGFPWHMGIEVTGGDGVRRTVRKSGTGWPKVSRAH